MKIDVNQFLKPCSCGRKHEIVVDDIIIDSGAINQLPEILKRPAYADKKSLVMICDENTYEAAGKQVEALVPGLKKIVLNPDNLHANEHGVEAAKKGLDEIGDVDMMIAVGSGTVHDIARFHAYEMKIPFFSVPTAASVDGFVSTVAAMTWHGFKKSFTAVSPVVVIADTDIFKKGTFRQLQLYISSRQTASIQNTDIFMYKSLQLIFFRLLQFSQSAQISLYSQCIIILQSCHFTIIKQCLSCFYTIILIIIYRNFYQRVRLQAV